jgi:trimethylamine--corrinoid protein Co-methyltransferase
MIQVVEPGHPVVLGPWPFVSDLRTGSFTGGSGEEALLMAATVQMGRYYDLPNSVAAGMTDAQIPDVQHGYEKGITLALASLAGANRICEAAGMMGSLMGCSFESLVIDNEILGMVLRATRGIEVNDETLSVDVIRESVIDPGHFLGHSQTMEYMESEYLYPDPALVSRDPADAWEQRGSTDLFARSQVMAEEILRQHHPRYLEESMDEAIKSRYPIRL